MKKKKIELEKKEIAFLIGVLEDLAENEIVEEEEQKEFELLNSIYLKLTKTYFEGKEIKYGKKFIWSRALRKKANKRIKRDTTRNKRE